MQHASQIAFGRPQICVQPIPAPASADKWDLLGALTQAARDLDLSHRTLGVLKALMTFLPDRQITAGKDAIVFPSNRTLSDRLNGMPESTLRRHLARLVELGIVSRHDSPNRKRFARRVGPGVALAFGFDLSPLAQHAAHVFSLAKAAQARSERIRVLKDRIAHARQQLVDMGHEDPLMEEARLILRRQVDEDTLEALCIEVEACAERLVKPVENTPELVRVANEMSASNSQNERHIQNSIKSESDSERAEKRAGRPDETPETLAQVLTACPEVQSFFPGQVNSWQDLGQVADRISPMLGIDAPVYQEACQTMGRKQAATVMACLLEKAPDLRSPGAYLRRLSQKARMGQFAVKPMVQALLNRDDTPNCQLTI